MLAIISFLPTKAEGALGGIDWSDEERRQIAKQYVFVCFMVLFGRSMEWKCPGCACKLSEVLPDQTSGSSASASDNKNDVDLSMFSLTYAKEAKSPSTETAAEASSSQVQTTPVATQELRQRATVVSQSPTAQESMVYAEANTAEVNRHHPRQKMIDLMLLFMFLALLPMLLRRLLIIITYLASKLS
jgi:ubiquitin-conjugating enzyme E2 J1